MPSQSNNQIQVQRPLYRPFLKWAGGKFRLLPRIQTLLPSGQRLIEPFLGGGAVFLNTDYPAYLLSDANPDLIDLYRILQKKGNNFIDQAMNYFTQENNQADRYYQFRQQFNETRNKAEKAALFLYLNRHGYNGLCRYNGRRVFNVPFGRYNKPYFPLNEMQAFHRQAQKAEFICSDFATTMKQACRGDVVYCDPPYLPLSQSAYFTAYSGKEFTLSHHELLALLAQKLAKKKIPVLLSNHDTVLSRQLYQRSEQIYFPVRRMISQTAHERAIVNEVLALFR